MLVLYVLWKRVFDILNTISSFQLILWKLYSIIKKLESWNVDGGKQNKKYAYVPFKNIVPSNLVRNEFTLTSV